MRAKGAGVGKFPNLVLMVVFFCQPSNILSNRHVINQILDWCTKIITAYIHAGSQFLRGGPMSDDRGYFAGVFFLTRTIRVLCRLDSFFFGGGAVLGAYCVDFQMCECVVKLLTLSLHFFVVVWFNFVFFFSEGRQKLLCQ